MTDTAKTGQEPTISSTPTPRQTIRESWVNYVGNMTYDLTRSAVDFLLEGILKELSVYAKTTSEKNDTNLDKFKGLIGTFTTFVRPKTIAMSDMIGSGVSYAAKNLIGNLIGQFYSAAKAQGYELDAKNKGWINKAVTAFARENVKYMIAGGLTFAGVGQTLLSVAPEFLTARIGATLASLLTGAGVGLVGKQLPSIYQFILSKLPTKTPEKPKPEEPKLEEPKPEEPKPEKPKSEEPKPEIKAVQDQVLTTEKPQPVAVPLAVKLKSASTLKTATSDLEPELDAEKNEPQKESAQIQAPTVVAVNPVPTLKIKPLSTALATNESEDFIPVPSSSSDNEADEQEQQATLHHKTRYYTPSADKGRSEIDLNQLPKTPEYSSEHDVDQEEAYGDDYQSSASMSESDREEGEYSAEQGDEPNRSRSPSRSSDASHRSSSSDDSSSRSPSPVQRKPYRRTR